MLRKRRKYTRYGRKTSQHCKKWMLLVRGRTHGAAEESKSPRRRKLLWRRLSFSMSQGYGPVPPSLLAGFCKSFLLVRLLTLLSVKVIVD
ncbi:hypothetical protein BaRGS_00020655 [Batillaria attramentaria]|uniref:Uncharacterized protein n=1 Tax=Batillaria attramentaria TaxID=370345 RepID=A0ABD0KLQ2_9CAEN